MPSAKANANSQHEVAAKGIEAIQAIVQERDHLQVQHDRMMTEIAIQRQRIEMLTGRLNQATVERDHYMRYATEITTKLNNIQMLIGSTVEEAKHAAYKPTAVVQPPRQPQLSSEDQQQLEQLIKNLPQGNTEGID